MPTHGLIRDSVERVLDREGKPPADALEQDETHPEDIVAAMKASGLYGTPDASPTRSRQQTA